MTFNKICKDIKDIKIQGAEAVARAGLKAVKLNHSKKAIRKLLALRPTEPLLQNSIKNALKFKNINEGIKNSLQHLNDSEKIISNLSFKIIKNAKIIYTHCHSSTVSNALINAFKKHKFKIHNTETRPLLQGRKTAKELLQHKIKVHMYDDSAIPEAIQDSDIIILGADWINKEGVVNKIGSCTVADFSSHFKKPFYILADSWKFSNRKLKLEQRPGKEIWNLKNKNLKIINPAFDLIPKKNIKAIISELGILSFKDFIRKVQK
ncbi:hypothetical protein HY498_01555 [Candidatus Woesearchaeota archaeon]|nr:hypothetical protein [Candidatus Woesearchaeota archaeon]